MEDEIDFKEYYCMIKKNWLLAISLFLIIFSATAAYTFSASPLFEAKSLVVVTAQDQTSALLGGPALRVDLETQAAIIKSSSVLIPVFDSIRQNFDYEITPIKNSEVIEIVVTSHDRFCAKNAANMIAESYVNYSLDSKQEDARRVIEFISDQLSYYQLELDELNKNIVSYESRINLSPEDSFEFQSFIQSRNIKEKLFDQLLLKREESSIVLRENSGNIKIIEYAQIPMLPVKPNKPLNLLLGFMLGGFVSIGIILFKESVAGRFTGLNDIKSELGDEVIGVIPEWKGKNSSYLVQHHDRNSGFSERIRMLRTNILFYLKDNDAKLVSILSSKDGEGKSSVALNLALSISQHDKKVLLIDANLRNPLLYKVFRISSALPGFSDVIMGDVDMDHAIKRTRKRNLSILTSGKNISYPSELLGSNKLKKVFENIRKKDFDIVIFDTSSLNYSESSILASRTDASLLVVAQDITKKEAAKNSLDLLKKMKVNMAGIVANKIK